MVTNCSKERPGSIVNETLKKGILMLKDTSKESDFHADSKYTSFILIIYVRRAKTKHALIQKLSEIT